MSSLFEQAFGTNDLYSVFEVKKGEFSLSQLRKAYYKKAKQYHPDKNQSDDDAKRKFQAISWAYSILKDPAKREIYDQDGIVHDGFGDDDDDMNENGSKKSWKDYFDMIFGKLNTDDIDSFAEKYKMSDEEERDVLKYYVQFKGNLKKMLGFVMLSEERDVMRWIEDYIQPAIEKNEVENYEDTINKTKIQIEKNLLGSAGSNNGRKSKAGKKREKQDRKKGTNDESFVVDPDETETESDNEEFQEATITDGKSVGEKKKNVPKKAGKSKSKLKLSQKKGKAKKKASSEDSLIAAIRNKRGAEGNPLASIASRYGVTADYDDPLDDAQFEKMRSKITSNKGKNGN